MFCFSSRRRHTRYWRDWSSDVCSSDLIELRPGGGAKIARSAGTSVQLVAREGRLAQLRMPSGEIRNVDVRCRATVGEVGNAEQSNINWGKAGRMRWKGKRPTVRGVAMNRSEEHTSELQSRQ